MSSQGSSSLLEYGTKLVGVSQAYWGLSLFPDAGEGAAVFHSADATPNGGFGGDPEESRRVAARRARTQVRRYCAANRLNRLGTLTYRPPFCSDPRLLRAQIAVFFRSLRRGLGGAAFPYLWTGEWHKDGVRLHAHFAVGRYVPQTKIEGAWPYGFVQIKRLGDLPYGSVALDQARVAARYLSKYVGKSFAEQRKGLHRYEVAQGFAPRREGARGRSSEEVLAWAAARMGRTPDLVQHSTDWPDHQGPPVVFFSWT
jgi:hypothetical protein